MIKLVNIYPTRPIVELNPPIRSYVRHITMPTESIRKCLLANARVEEIISPNNVVVLDLSNYDKELAPVEKVVPVVEKKVKKPEIKGVKVAPLAAEPVEEVKAEEPAPVVEETPAVKEPEVKKVELVVEEKAEEAAPVEEVKEEHVKDQNTYYNKRANRQQRVITKNQPQQQNKVEESAPAVEENK